jgi:hypothetical protein
MLWGKVMTRYYIGIYVMSLIINILMGRVMYMNKPNNGNRILDIPTGLFILSIIPVVNSIVAVVYVFADIINWDEE